MPPIHPLAAAHERARWLRHDAHHFIRRDWRRFVKPGSEFAALYEEIERKYWPDQPRVPAGVREGGQWTEDGAGGGNGRADTDSGVGRTDPRVVSDANPENDAKPGAQYAQNRRPGSGFSRIVINGRVVEPTPGQAARLAVVEAQARDAIRRVNELDPKWKPAPSEYNSVEGYISAYQADAEQARERLSELSRNGIGPGPFAVDSIPARGPERNFTAEERRLINEMGTRFGCHSCGTTEPETTADNFVPDHQPPSALNFRNREQRLYPQCLTCSRRQGGVVNGLKE